MCLIKQCQYQPKIILQMQTSESGQSYQAVITELANSNIDVSDAYIYTDHKLSNDFDQYFKFCQECLSVLSSPDTFDIEPSRFYFSDSVDVNATAFPRENNFFRVTVNRGTVEEIYNLFCNNNVLDDPQLKDYKKLDDYYRQSPYQTSLNYITFDQCLFFIFFHELGHLVQFSKHESFYKGHSNLNAIEEKNMTGGMPFDIADHIMEIDADRQAANYLGGGIWGAWSKLPIEDRTDDKLKGLIVMSLVSVLSFFIMLVRFPKNGIYYYESTHPHPLVRLMWVSKIVVDVIEAHRPSAKNLNIMDETLRVLNIYSQYNNLGDVYKNYVDPYRKHADEIAKYLYSLVETSRKPEYEFLS
jgi:hypothetical protein